MWHSRNSTPAPSSLLPFPIWTLIELLRSTRSTTWPADFFRLPTDVLKQLFSFVHSLCWPYRSTPLTAFHLLLRCRNHRSCCHSTSTRSQSYSYYVARSSSLHYLFEKNITDYSMQKMDGLISSLLKPSGLVHFQIFLKHASKTEGTSTN